MKIYLAHPISGKSYDEVTTYYTYTKRVLEEAGWEVLCPMTGKSYLRNDKKFRPHGYDNPLSTNQAIVARDFWMVNLSDVVYVNLTTATEVSIGCVSEIAYAFSARKNIVIAMPKEGPHAHAFIFAQASAIFDNHQDVMAYLEKLTSGDL